MINQAKLSLQIATKAHKGQFRKDGVTPYIEHPMAVAKPFRRPLRTWPNKEDRAVYISAALLHDVVEDSTMTNRDLLDQGVDPFIVFVVDILTHKKSESYLDYLLRVKTNYIALFIKIEDIKHNMSSLGPENSTKRDKYMLALYILEH